MHTHESAALGTLENCRCDSGLMFESAAMRAGLQALEAKLKTATPAQVAAVEKSGQLDAQEHFAAQEKKSVLFASGLLPADVAQDLFRLLGPSSSHFNGLPLAYRLLGIQVACEVFEVFELAKGGRA